MATLAILALLAATTLLLRVPFLAPRLAHWDAVNYALGLHEFNIAAHQPHPPGSPYFILLGRAVLALVGDDNRVLLLISLGASVGAVLGEYVLARLLFGRRAAVLAAVILMTQPVFWGYGTTATAWTLLACLAAVIGVVSLLLARGHRRLVFPSAAILGIASGFRLDVTVFMVPLWAWAITRAEKHWPRRLIAVGLLAGSVLLWLVPVAVGAGGLSVWSGRLIALFPSTDATPAAIARQLAANTAISFGTLALLLAPALILGLAVHRRRAVCWIRTTSTSTVGVFLGLWILPAFTFLWLIDSTEPGHNLVFAGALAAIAAGLLVQTARNTREYVTCGAVVVAVQAGIFVFAGPQYNRPLAWTMDSMLLNVTAPGLSQQQTSLDSTLRILRLRFDPHDSVVVTLTGQDPYRFMMYYLPEYAVLRLDPGSGSVLTARNQRQGNWVQPTGCLFASVVGVDVRHAAWVVSSWSEPGIIPEAAVLVSPPPDTAPFQVWELQTSQSPLDYLGFKISGDCHAD